MLRKKKIDTRQEIVNFITNILKRVPKGTKEREELDNIVELFKKNYKGD